LPHDFSLAYIYGVHHPGRPDRIFVVGKTCQPLKARLGGYRSAARHKSKHGTGLQPSERWVLCLLQRGLRPEIRLLETCRLTDRKPRECFHIARWKRINPRLCNRLPGGEGPEPGGTRLKLVCDKCGRARTRNSWGQLGCRVCGKAYRTAYDRKRRGPLCPQRGERHHKAKLSSLAVRVIRRLHGRLSLRAIGGIFGVQHMAVQAIFQGRGWKHVLC